MFLFGGTAYTAHIHMCHQPAYRSPIPACMYLTRQPWAGPALICRGLWLASVASQRPAFPTWPRRQACGPARPALVPTSADRAQWPSRCCRAQSSGRQHGLSEGDATRRGITGGGCRRFGSYPVSLLHWRASAAEAHQVMLTRAMATEWFQWPRGCSRDRVRLKFATAMSWYTDGKNQI